MSDSDICLYFSQSGYLETGVDLPAGRNTGPAPKGLVGREVASKEFLNAYLSHGKWDQLSALVPDARSEKSLRDFCVAHPSSGSRKRRLRTLNRAEFRKANAPPAPVLHFPCPAEASYAWLRQRTRKQFALSGVTHTMCSRDALEAMRNLLIAPYQPYDRLICTSEAVKEMVRSVTGNFAGYLKERFGGAPRNIVPLEVIPLGVDTSRFRPATDQERSAARSEYDIRDDEVCALFVGRLSHHAKANPVSMYKSLAAASRETGKPVHLLMSGWAANKAIMDAFRDGSQRFAPNIRCTFVDGTEQEHRQRVWHAADFFISLVDNIQETFGLVIVEAMASGLPVVATDWNGYRDLLTGQTGFPIRTWLFRDSDADLTTQLLTREISYDRFLAIASQQTIVDVAHATRSIARLLADTQLRQTMSAAGRQHVVANFAWANTISRYETMWSQQARELDGWKDMEGMRAWQPPAAYPPFHCTFSGYPTKWLDGDTILTATGVELDSIDEMLGHGLSGHAIDELKHRSAEIAPLLRSCTDDSAQFTLSELTRQAERSGMRRATTLRLVAWLIKYGFINVVSPHADDMEG